MLLVAAAANKSSAKNSRLGGAYKCLAARPHQQIGASSAPNRMNVDIVVRGAVVGTGALLVVAALDLGFPFRHGAIPEDYLLSTLIVGAALLLLVVLRAVDEERRDDIAQRNGTTIYHKSRNGARHARAAAPSDQVDGDIAQRNGTTIYHKSRNGVRHARAAAPSDQVDDDAAPASDANPNNHVGWVLLSNKSFSGKGLAANEQQARRRMQRLADRQLPSRLAANQLAQLQSDLLANAPQYFAACDHVVYAGTRNGVLRSALAKCIGATRLDALQLE